ncbi:hypothetical protein BC830DRAFT_729745 [Chytriomyces sp. MP71]|nr:hypothetical protein BC830DRAFT_729745 [Chytriomyces sp. MP71]
MLTSVVRPIHKIKSKPNLDMVEMTVDQIVQSVVKGAAPVPHSPFGAHAAAEKKSVRFHEEDSKSPLGAGVGFKPRAEIARTPLKMASAGSLSATPARTALLRQATTASAAAARQGSVSTSKKVSVRGTPLPVATAALRFRGTTCLKSPIISNRGLDETGESWLLDNVDEADTVNLLDEAVPVFMAERATIWEDGGGLEKAFEQQTTHRQEAVSVSTATTHPTTCAFDDFAPPSANKPLFLHSTVTRDDAAFGDASLSDGFEGASALDISMANPLEEMSFWQPPHDARHGSIGGNDISFLQAMEDEENLCSEGNPMLLGMNTNGAAESHIDDLAVFTLPPLPPSSNVSENDLEIPTDLVGIKSSADVVRVDTTTGAVFPQGKAAIDSHTDFEGLILPPLPPSCDVSGELFVEKEDVAGVKSECMAATSQPAFLDQARRKSLSDQRGIQAFLRVSDEPKGQNVAHEPEEFGEPSSLPSKSLDEGEVAVASIHISDLSLPPSISPQELIEPAVGKSLMDSFVAWKKDVSDAVLISDEAPLVNEGEERLRLATSLRCCLSPWCIKRVVPCLGRPHLGWIQASRADPMISVRWWRDIRIPVV